MVELRVITTFQQVNQLQVTKSEIATLENEKVKIIGSTNARLAGLNRQILSLSSELDRVKELIKYKTITAPTDGLVFNLRVNPTSVVSTTETLFKLSLLISCQLA